MKKRVISACLVMALLFAMLPKISFGVNASIPEEWETFLSTRAFWDYMSGSASQSRDEEDLQYAIYDLNADGTTELVIQNTWDAPFYSTWLFVLHENRIVLASEDYGYGMYQYSPKHNMVIGSPETKPFSGTGYAPFYSLTGTELVYEFQIGQNMGTSYYSDASGRVTISDEERTAYFADVVWLDFKKMEDVPKVEADGHRYMIVDQSMTWTEAKAYCEQLGGHLVTITSEEEKTVVCELLAGGSMNCYWIGLYRDGVRADWEWVTGENLAYTDWAESEPNNYQSAGECYAHLHSVEYVSDKGYRKHVGQWNDVSNNGASYSGSFYAKENFGFICEFEDSEDDAPSNSNSIDAYRDVLNMYHTSISCNWSDCDDEGWENVGDPDNACYIFWRYEADRTLSEVGYALLDINNDGQCELFVSMLDIAESGSFYDMYTIVDGEIIHVVTAGERDRYNLADNYTINNNGSGSAATGIHVNYSLDSASSLKINHAIEYDYNREPRNYYTNTDSLHGVYQPISNEEAEALLDSFPENTALKLTPFDEYNPQEDDGDDSGIVVYSDYTNLSIRKNSTITLSAEIRNCGDPSDLTFQVTDMEMLKVIDVYTKDNRLCVKLRGLEKGTSTVVFCDSNTGRTVQVPITVYDNNKHFYSLSNVPTQQIEKYPTNFYNVNGLYVDNYTYEINSDQTATVSFDVYNTNYTYGVVEILDENGKVKDAILIEKNTSSTTGFKEAVLDNLGYLVRDIFQRDMFTYRQESGYSKKTSVSVKVPKNGYIKIVTDPENSSIVSLVNYADLLLALLEFTGEITQFSVNSKEFSQKLTAKMLNGKIFAELVNDSDKMTMKLWKNIGKESLITSESMGSFVETAIKNLSEFGLIEVIMETASDCGWSIGEKVFTDLAGPYGVALKLIFAGGKAENIIIQHHDLTHSAGVGSIYIQNQGGGFRACQQIKIESEGNFSDDTALSVFSVALESTLLELLREVDPDAYQAISEGVTYTYNISLLRDGEELQPDGKVTVYIPIPEALEVLAYTGKVKVYRVEENGSLTQMDIKIRDGCFVFTTDHFSLYTLVGYDSEAVEEQIVLGDVDGSGDVNFFDGMYVLQYYAGLIDETQLNVIAADVDGSGEVDFFDGMYILQYYAGVIASLPVRLQ